MRGRCLTFAVEQEDLFLPYLWHVSDAIDQGLVPLLGFLLVHLRILVTESEY